MSISTMTPSSQAPSVHTYHMDVILEDVKQAQEGIFSSVQLLAWDDAWVGVLFEETVLCLESSESEPIEPCDDDDQELGSELL